MSKESWQERQEENMEALHIQLTIDAAQKNMTVQNYLAWMEKQEKEVEQNDDWIRNNTTGVW